MKMRSRNRFQKQVSEILKQHRIVRPPVPVEKIATDLGIEVRYEPAEGGLSGALIRHGREVVIGVNSLHHFNRQRFTIAHEIGHFLLHAGMQFHVDEDFRINLRDEESSRAVYSEEIDANRFAAELLMPTELIKRDVQKLRNVDESSVPSLARRYQVSPRAMELRLTNLGLFSPV